MNEVCLLGIEEGLQFTRAMAAGEGVWVLALGEQDDLDTTALLQQKVDPAEGSADARSIAVVEDGDIRREAP